MPPTFLHFSAYASCESPGVVRVKSSNRDRWSQIITSVNNAKRVRNIPLIVFANSDALAFLKRPSFIFPRRITNFAQFFLMWFFIAFYFCPTGNDLYLSMKAGGRPNQDTCTRRHKIRFCLFPRHLSAWSRSFFPPLFPPSRTVLVPTLSAGIFVFFPRSYGVFRRYSSLYSHKSMSSVEMSLLIETRSSKRQKHYVLIRKSRFF